MSLKSSAFARGLLGVGFLAAAIVGGPGCVRAVKLPDTRRPIDTEHDVGKYRWCVEGRAPPSTRSGESRGRACQTVAKVHLVERSPTWFDFMLRACDYDYDAACGVVAHAALGGEILHHLDSPFQVSRLEAECSAGDQVSCHALARAKELLAVKPPSRAIQERVLKSAEASCRAGRRDYDSTSWSGESVGNTCYLIGFLKGQLLPEKPTFAEVEGVKRAIVEYARRGCEVFGSGPACAVVERRTGKADWAALRGIKREEEAAEERQAALRQAEAAEERRWQDAQVQREAADRAQFHQQLQDNFRTSQKNFQDNVALSHQIASSGQARQASPEQPPRVEPPPARAESGPRYEPPPPSPREEPPVARAAECRARSHCLDARSRKPTGAGRCEGEVTGSFTNTCAERITCTICPADSQRRPMLEKCHLAELAANERSAGELSGQWWCGIAHQFSGFVFKCAAPEDPPSCRKVTR